MFSPRHKYPPTYQGLKPFSLYLALQQVQSFLPFEVLLEYFVLAPTVFLPYLKSWLGYFTPWSPLLEGSHSDLSCVLQPL